MRQSCAARTIAAMVEAASACPVAHSDVALVVTVSCECSTCWVHGIPWHRARPMVLVPRAGCAPAIREEDQREVSEHLGPESHEGRLPERHSTPAPDSIRMLVSRRTSACLDVDDPDGLRGRALRRRHAPPMATVRVVPPCLGVCATLAGERRTPQLLGRAMTRIRCQRWPIRMVRFQHSRQPSAVRCSTSSLSSTSRTTRKPLGRLSRSGLAGSRSACGDGHMTTGMPSHS